MQLNFTLVLFLLIHCSWATPRFIDLSHDYSSTTLHWPNTKPFQISRIVFSNPQSLGFYFSSRDYESNEHVGTHMDAPNHFAKDHPE